MKSMSGVGQYFPAPPDERKLEVMQQGPSCTVCTGERMACGILALHRPKLAHDAPPDALGSLGPRDPPLRDYDLPPP